MKVYSNVGDPKKKKKSSVDGDSMEKGPVTQKVLKERRTAQAKTSEQIQGKEGKTYEGNPAPRVGGKAEKSYGMSTGTSSNRIIRLSKRRAKGSDASKAAKKAAIRRLKGKN
jgi:hypothetical protein